MPAYQLTSVIDDTHYGVDLIVRGKDLYNSSLAQVFLAKSLKDAAFEKVSFYHHPILKGPDGKKLAKSDGSTSIQFLRKSGKSLEEVYHLLGKMMQVEKPIRNFDEFKAALAF